MKQKQHFLALADGDIFYGESRGSSVDRLGEAVFNTGMSGYEEIVTDPSYAGQTVALTAAEIGNYGCNEDDRESRGLFLSGLIVQELNAPSNYRSTLTLPELLGKYEIPILSNVDTRRLVLKLRTSGTQKSYLHCSDEIITVEEAVRRAREWSGLDMQDYAAKVSCREKYVWNNEGDLSVAVMDFGVKHQILRDLAAKNLKVTVYPAWTDAKELLAAKPDGVFLSNGPADPAAVKGAIQTARDLIGRVPLMGICLGHQILGLAAGARTGRLKFGHHGCNHPVKNLLDNSVEITSQNHNFAIVEESLPAALEITRRNLNDLTIEGVCHRTEPVVGIQYHPEAAPGPHDAKSIFQTFRKLLEEGKAND